MSSRASCCEHDPANGCDHPIELRRRELLMTGELEERARKAPSHRAQAPIQPRPEVLAKAQDRYAAPLQGRKDAFGLIDQQRKHERNNRRSYRREERAAPRQVRKSLQQLAVVSTPLLTDPGFAGERNDRPGWRGHRGVDPGWIEFADGAREVPVEPI